MADRMDMREIAIKILDHFFEHSPYGDPMLCGPDTTLLCWPHVRHLVFDALNQDRGIEKSRFVNLKYNDQFLQDIVKEARDISHLIPDTLSLKDWPKVAGVAYGLLVDRESLYLRRGLISEKGQTRLRLQTLLGGIEVQSGDQYERAWEQFKKEHVTPKVA